MTAPEWRLSNEPAETYRLYGVDTDLLLTVRNEGDCWQGRVRSRDGFVDQRCDFNTREEAQRWVEEQVQA